MIEHRHIQAIGAALSRRDWHATEVAYNAIRDEFDALPAKDAVGEAVEEARVEALHEAALRAFGAWHEGVKRDHIPAAIRALAASSPPKDAQPPYPEGDVVGPCVCGSWPGGPCLRCEWRPAKDAQPQGDPRDIEAEAYMSGEWTPKDAQPDDYTEVASLHVSGSKEEWLAALKAARDEKAKDAQP